MTERLMMALVFLGTVIANAAPVVTNLHAEYRSGQVFLTWKEASVPDENNLKIVLDPDDKIQEITKENNCGVAMSGQ